MKPRTLAGYVLLAGLALPVALAAGQEPMLVDDFEDGIDDGWVRIDQCGRRAETPGGAGVFEVRKGEYVLETRDTMPAGTSDFLASKWIGAPTPWYDHGTIRATLRHGSHSTTAWIGLRGACTVDGGYVGYRFEIPACGGWLRIARVSGSDDETVKEVVFIIPIFHPGDQVEIAAGVVGPRLHLKVWRSSEEEPAVPQLIASDGEHPTGGLVVGVSHNGPDDRICGIFDDITYAMQRPGDVTGDEVVDVADLLAVVAAWGHCWGCPEDLTGDLVVGFDDLLVVLAHWSPPSGV